MNMQYKSTITLSLVLITVLCLCNKITLPANTANKSICMTMATTDSVSPIPPYSGCETHYDYIPSKSFLFDNKAIELINENTADAIDSIQLIIFQTFRKDGIHSGATSGDSYILEFPYVFIYASAFWKEKGKPTQIVFDSITECGDVYFNHLEKPFMLKPGDFLILKDTVYDTIRNTFAGKNDILYAHRHVKTDSIVNLGYFPFN